MRSLTLPVLFAIALFGCGADPALPGTDAGPPSWHEDASSDLADAGSTEHSTDAGTSAEDAGSPSSDAGVEVPDVSTRVDTGAPAPDAGSIPTPTPDAGATPADAGSGGAPDAPPVGCREDAFEANDGPALAVPVASGSGWPLTHYPMTWHEGDASDWISADLDSTGIRGTFRVHASDVDSGAMVEVRVTCLSGLRVCRGSNASSSGATCTGRRTFNAYVDVDCVDVEAPRVEVSVGVERGRRACEHEMTVNLAAAP